ncbi:MarR family winged helix-turn-helix transcriptional regulator [Azospirillum halopraeferens]|uniref:MarR family winged helix-turn-helix transcriptional regulator n=1 Tax=Azospirillum halopraeferens TaxID=34010 RepID=UPI0003FABAEA|nr:MarR family transcriptional regulator [Azospirillum halopraeferens]
MDMQTIAYRIEPDAESPAEVANDYVLANQINHRLRRAHQRASGIFLETIGDAQLTPTQWAALVTLHREGPLSQNQLGRLTFMDPATTQGVILRLVERALVERRPDPQDRRRTSVRLTRAGQTLVNRLQGNATRAHARTLEPLSADEQRQFLALLERLM